MQTMIPLPGEQKPSYLPQMPGEVTGAREAARGLLSSFTPPGSQNVTGTGGGMPGAPPPPGQPPQAPPPAPGPNPNQQITMGQLSSVPDYVAKFLVDLSRKMMQLPEIGKQPYVVGENGPEILSPGAGQGGNITPNGQIPPPIPRQEGGPIGSTDQYPKLSTLREGSAGQTDQAISAPASQPVGIPSPGGFVSGESNPFNKVWSGMGKDVSGITTGFGPQNLAGTEKNPQWVSGESNPFTTLGRKALSWMRSSATPEAWGGEADNIPPPSPTSVPVPRSTGYPSQTGQENQAYPVPRPWHSGNYVPPPRTSDQATGFQNYGEPDSGISYKMGGYPNIPGSEFIGAEGMDEQARQGVLSRAYQPGSLKLPQTNYYDAHPEERAADIAYNQMYSSPDSYESGKSRMQIMNAGDRVRELLAQPTTKENAAAKAEAVSGAGQRERDLRGGYEGRNLTGERAYPLLLQHAMEHGPNSPYADMMRSHAQYYRELPEAQKQWHLASTQEKMIKDQAMAIQKAEAAGDKKETERLRRESTLLNNILRFGGKNEMGIADPKKQGEEIYRAVKGKRLSPDHLSMVAPDVLPELMLRDDLIEKGHMTKAQADEYIQRARAAGKI